MSIRDTPEEYVCSYKPDRVSPTVVESHMKSINEAFYMNLMMT